MAKDKIDKQTELINKAVRRLYVSRCQYEALKAEMDETKTALQQYLQEKKVKEIVVEVPEGEVNGFPAKKLKASLITKMSVTYDVDQLRENLDHEIFNEVTHKSYTVTNIELLKKLFKEAGLSPKQLKQCISSTTYASPGKLQQLYAVGDITKHDLKGAYTAKLEKHIRVASTK